MPDPGPGNGPGVRHPWRDAGAVAAFTPVYFLAAELGHLLAVEPGPVASVWPPTGLLFAVLIVAPLRLWPAYLFVAAAVDVASDVLTHGTPLPVGAGSAAADVLEAVVAAGVVRWSRGRLSGLATLADVVAAVVALVAGCAAGAAVDAGVASSAAGADFAASWRVRWLADLVGGLVVAPLLLAWGTRPPRLMTVRRGAEAVALAAGAAGLTAVIFHGGTRFLSFPGLVLPFLLWAGVRFEFRGVTLAVAGFAAMAFAYTAAGVGPFVRPDRNPDQEVFVAQALVGIFAVCFLGLAGVAAEWGRAKAALRAANADLEARVRDRTADLNRQTELLRTTLASIGDGVAATDPAGRVTFLNPVAADLTGWSAAAAAGRPLDDVFRVDRERTPRAAESPVDRVLRDGLTVALANRTVLTARDGTERAVEVSAAPIREGAAVAGAVLVFRDVTERRRAEDAVRASEARFRLLGEVAEATRGEADPGRVMETVARMLGRHLRASRCAYADVGPDRFVVRHDYTDGCPSTVGAYPRGSYGPAVTAAMREGRTFVLRDAAREVAPGDGGEAFAASGIAALVCRPLVKAGELVAMLGVHQTTPRDWTADEVALVEVVAERCWADIERARADRAVRDGERRLRLSLDSGGMGTWEIDEATGVATVDATECALFGLPPGTRTLPLPEFFDLVHPDDRGAVGERLAAARAGSGDYDAEFRVLRPDGRVVWLAGKGRVQFDAGRPVRTIGVNYDVTERRRTEEALREADRKKDEFLATLAHELRNPLAPVRNALQILALSGDDAAAVGKVRGVMTRQIGHMVRLIDDLLDLSRVTRGMITLRPGRVDLADAVRAAVETSRPGLDAARHALAVDLPPAPVPVTGDLTRLSQVVSNLLNNAAKYTPPGGRVCVELARDGADAVVRVTDTGLGLPPDQIDRVWDLFAQVNRRLDRSQGGLGIGLALVRKLVEMHGGTAAVESAGPGRGSTFTVRLPAAEVSEPTPRADPGDAPPAAPAPAARRRVLIVDDNVDSADSLADLIRAMGHEVRVAYDGPTGLRESAFGPDVALLDIGMPGMDGLELAARLRGTPAGRAAVLVAQTGWGQEDDRRRTRAAGFDHHLTKPIDPAALRDILAADRAN